MKYFQKFLRSMLSFSLLLCFPSCVGVAEKSFFNLDNAMGKENLVDMLVVGSGPAGCSAALNGARARLNVLVLEGNMPGGQLTRTTWIENFTGIDNITGPELAKRMKKQVENFGAEFLADSLEKIDCSSWPYKVTTENGMIIHAMTVVVATGSSPRKLNVPGEEEYFGRGVSHCAICDGRFFAGEDVLVVGGGDSAVEEAIQLINFGVKRVIVLVRSEKMRAVRCMQDRLRSEEQVIIKHNTVIKEIIGDGEKITRVKVFDNISGETYDIPASAVFLAIGSVPNTWFLKGVANMNAQNKLIMQGRTQKTSVSSVFAAGNIEEGAIDQIIIACGKGRTAGIEAVNYLTGDMGLDRKTMAKLKDSYYKGKVATSTVGEIKKIENNQEFKKEIFEENKDKLVLVDFYTDTCPSCMQMMPAIEEVAKDYTNKLKVFKLDASDDKFEDILKDHNVLRVPRLLLFKNGEIIEDHKKALSRKEISDMVERHL